MRRRFTLDAIEQEIANSGAEYYQQIAGGGNMAGAEEEFAGMDDVIM